MKKILFAAIILFTVLFSSCFHGNPKPEYQDPAVKSITVNTYTDGPVYLNKLNISNEIIEDKKTGYAARSIEAYDKPVNTTDGLIQRENQRIYDLFKGDDASRAATTNLGTVAEDGGNETNYSVGKTLEFNSIVGQNIVKNSKGEITKIENITEDISSKCVYAGEHCYIFADQEDTELEEKGITLTVGDYEDLGATFDSIYALETSVIGNPIYKNYIKETFVRSADKIIIFVSDLYGDANPDQQGGTVGYFRPADLLTQGYLDKNINRTDNGGFIDKDNSKYVKSNGYLMFYIDSLFYTKYKDMVYSTLVHEFNHMINYVVKTIKYSSNHTIYQSNDTWFTEMLSMVTEDMFQDYLHLEDKDSPKARLYLFNQCYNYGFKLWNYFDSGSVEELIIYANTYAFGAFLARNFGGVELIKEIAQNDYVNEAAITQALKKLNPDISGINFDYVLEKFSMSLFNTKAPTAEQAARTGTNKYLTFNRSTEESGDLYFTPIDLGNIKVINKNNEEEIIKPVFYYAEEKGRVSLGPYGFSLHWVANSDCPSFTIKYPASQHGKIKFFLITF